MVDRAAGKRQSAEKIKGDFNFSLVKVMRQVLRNFARSRRQDEFFWRYGFNFLPSINYRFAASPPVNETAKRVLADLDRQGIAVTSFAELFGDSSVFSELETATAKLLASRAAELETLRKQATDTTRLGDKTFNVELLGSRVDFDAASVFARLALNETFLTIADKYFGMKVKMRYYNVWQTFASVAPARESQLWHYDREDKYILKVFLYLKDVDEGAGPFTYAPQTHQKGTLRGRDPDYFLENNVRRTKDEQMAKVVAEEKWIRGVGRRGTLIFADTRGYHKGGEAKTSDRLMYTCMYTSPASESARLLNFATSENTSRLTKTQLAALELH
jgi:Phytanoyl-CoA dioxygenase (PhyH)